MTTKPTSSGFLTDEEIDSIERACSCFDQGYCQWCRDERFGKDRKCHRSHPHPEPCPDEPEPPTQPRGHPVEICIAVGHAPGCQPAHEEQAAEIAELRKVREALGIDFANDAAEECRKLQTELAEAKRELKNAINELIESAHDKGITIDTLRADLERSRADTKRLDWMDRTQDPCTLAGGSGEKWCVEAGDGTAYASDDLREAIDAAMAAEVENNDG